MDTFIKAGSIAVGLMGVGMLLVTPAGWVFIILGLLIFAAYHNAERRADERRWREQMLSK